MDRRYRDWLLLNGKITSLAIKRQWINSRHVAASYNEVSENYSENWLKHLSPVSRRLLHSLPEKNCSRILDLGCGTGFTTEKLAEKYPEAQIVAQDLSTGMLNVARKNSGHPAISFDVSDMLKFIQSQPADSADLIVSAWAIGYSNPQKIIQECFRTLNPGGHFAFVVNLMDTLKPVYIAFRKTMQRHSSELMALALPNFPASWKKIAACAQKAGFKITYHEDSEVKICNASDASLEWLLKTGILAGFDAMLPLSQNQRVAESFEHYLHEQTESLSHHYIMAVLEKS